MEKTLGTMWPDSRMNNKMSPKEREGEKGETAKVSLLFLGPPPFFTSSSLPHLKLPFYSPSS